MSIEITENTIGLWFMQLSETADFHAGLQQIGPESFELIYRFRYYDQEDPGNDPFSKQDRKSWWKGQFSGPKEKALLAMREFCRQVGAVQGYEFDEVLMIDGNVAEFFEVLRGREWCHFLPQAQADEEI